jgi:hypothetical protein
MSDTFNLGLSEDIYTSMMHALTHGLKDFASAIAQPSAIDIAQIPNLDGLIKKTRTTITDSILDKAREQHAYPLRRILAALAVDEMADLAETLISLQSLKEKLTKPSETVGGPIDVAVITRNEGLVWIKRKRFFDPKLNSRYMQRQAAVYK